MASTSDKLLRLQSMKKRKRLHDSEGQPTQTPIPIRGQPYVDEGNVILAVETTHFRVYYGVLAGMSPVFANMCSGSESPVDEKLIDGCPVIELDDSAADWGHVLRNIFEKSYSPAKISPLSISVVTAYLRLGTKYEMVRIREEAVQRLTYEFPTTLAALDSTVDYSRIEDPKSVTLEFFSAIQLAHQFNIPQILPWAFYGCCYYLTFKQICQPEGPLHPSLSREDVQTCLVGWQKLVEQQARDTFAWLNSTCTSEKSDVCNAARQKMRQHFAPLPACKALDPWQPWQQGLCEECAADAKVSHEAGRKKIWDKLPLLFGLPSWFQLLRE